MDDPIINPQAVTPVSTQAVPADVPQTPSLDKAESREEKLRRAKIAMEGLDRTIRREATEKEEQASEEKQQLNKLLLSLDHEKELLELTWVNLDDKRASLKKVLDPILAQEDKVENDETSLESQEEVTLEPKSHHELEQKRWQIQEARKKIEEEKWVVEEKIQKIDDQVEEIRQKYQKLLAQEEELRQKVQAIDEQMILQQEVLRQQHELEEQKRRQEALKKVEEQKRQQETEQQRLAATEAEKARQQAEKEQAPKETKQSSPEEIKETEQQRLEKLRQAEEERQKQETTRRLQTQQEREQLLRKSIAEAIDNQQTGNISNQPAEASTEKNQEIQRALELERIKRENEEADADRQRQIEEKNRSVISSIKESGGEIEPLRTLKGDLATALKNNEVTDKDLARVNKKVFPWVK